MLEEAAFHDELAQALRHLGAPDVLGNLPLSSSIAGSHDSAIGRGTATRQVIVEAIDRLKPAGPINLDSPDWRIHTILHERYVLHHSPGQLERQLNLGDRQVRREHKRAVAVLAALLASQVDPSTPQSSSTTSQRESVREAVHRLQPAPRLFGLRDLFSDVVGVASTVTGDADVPAWVTHPPDVTVFADRGILSQLLLKMILPHQGPGNGGTLLSAELHGEAVHLKVSGSGLHAEGVDYQLMHMLGEALGTTLVIAPDGSLSEFALPVGGPLHSVLVIDDEPMAVELLRSYLAGTEFDVTFEVAPEAAVQTALAKVPDVIVLDVMMPAMDGWALLQRLRTIPATREVPIIVYSILDESSLAEALGATRFLRKPIGRLEWLNILRATIR